MTSPAYAKPLPAVSEVSRPYWDGLRNHEFKLQSCSACSHTWFPPSFICPRCLSADIGWKSAAGRGKVWSYMRMWQRYFPGFAEDLPYIIAYVELDEGPRLMTTIVGTEYSEIRCDMPVEIVYDDVTEELTLPKFRAIGHHGPD